MLSRNLRVVVGIAALSVLWPGKGPAFADDVANPAAHTSPSGRFVLTVEPSQPDGSGAAAYRLTRDGTEVWTGDLDFSLWDAIVTDEGAVAGYAYEGGVMAGGNHGTEYTGLAAYILGPDGAVRLRDSIADDNSVPRGSGMVSDSPAVLGLLWHPSLDRFVVRFAGDFNAGGEIWRIYGLADAARGDDLRPGFPSTDDGFEHCVSAAALPGTPLTVMHWYTERTLGTGRTMGASVVVVDGGGSMIWRFELPGEYDGIREHWNWHWDRAESGIEQVSLLDGGFAIRSHSLGEEMSFAVERSADEASGWSVRETGREETGPLFGVARTIETIELEPAGTIVLRGPAAPANSIGRVSEFAIDEAGRIGWVRRGENRTMRFVLFDKEGAPVCDMDLGIPPDEATGPALATPLGGDRWIVHHRYSSFAKGTGAWLVDAGTRTVTPLEGFAATGMVVPAPGGGCLSITPGNAQTGGAPCVIRFFDRDGLLTREVSGPGVSRFGSMQDAACLSDGRVVVLIGVVKTLEFISAEGVHTESVDLGEMIGGRANYPVAVSPDPTGGFVLHDFNGSPPVYRVNAEGEVTARFEPRFSDGRTFRLAGDVQVAPDGRMWTSDGEALLRLDDSGVVDRVLGPSPDEPGMDRTDATTVGADGTIYVLNRRTAAVHAFDAEGNSVRAFTPDPTDFPTDSGLGHIAVDGDGGVHYRTNSFGDGARYLSFTVDGDRVDERPTAGGDWYFQPGTMRKWVLGYDEIVLRGEDGLVIRRITKRADGDWLEVVRDGAVAPDGSLAVVTAGRSLGARGGEISIYDRDGEPVGVVACAEGSLTRPAFDGRTVVTVGRDEVFLYDRAGGVKRFVPPIENAGEAFWYPYFSPDGKELWLHNAGTLELHRFRLP